MFSFIISFDIIVYLCVNEIQGIKYILQSTADFKFSLII